MTELRGPVLNVDWGQAVTTWSVVVGLRPRARRRPLEPRVAEDDGRNGIVAGDEGGVRQTSIFIQSLRRCTAGGPRSRGPTGRGLTSIAASEGSPPSRRFNEATLGAPEFNGMGNDGLQRWDHFPLVPEGERVSGTGRSSGVLAAPTPLIWHNLTTPDPSDMRGFQDSRIENREPLKEPREIR